MTPSAPYVEYRDRLRKAHGAEVSTDVFLDPASEHVSAILYGEANWCPGPSHEPGADFKIVHNPKAAIPLRDGWFPAGHEYWWRDDSSIESMWHGRLD